MAYYKTSDGNIFYTRNAAENHAKTLQDKVVLSTSSVVELSKKEIKEFSKISNSETPEQFEVEMPNSEAPDQSEVEDTKSEESDQTEVEDTKSEEAEQTEVEDTKSEDLDQSNIESNNSEVSEYENLSKKELLNIASELGLTASDRFSKQQIITLIDNAKKSK